MTPYQILKGHFGRVIDVDPIVTKLVSIKDKAPVTATETTIDPATEPPVLSQEATEILPAEPAKMETIMWVTVSYNGGTGYVKGSLLSSTEVAKATY